MTFFSDTFERGLNFTASNGGTMLAGDAPNMIARAVYDGFTHGFLVITLAGGLTSTQVGVGPALDGGPAPSPGTPNGSFTFGRSDLTMSDQCVAAWCDEAVSRGFKLRLRPWLYPSAWRGAIVPGANPDGSPNQDGFATFMANLRAVTNHYAAIGAAHGADGMSVGSEYVRLDPLLYPVADPYVGATGEWKQLISEVRSIMGSSAKLSYGANEFAGSGRGIEWNNQKFWDHPDLDYIGIDQYGSMATTNERADDGQYISARQINGRFRYGVPRDVNNVVNKVAYNTQFASLSAQYGGKKVIFEEYGFPPYRTTGQDGLSNPISGGTFFSGLDYTVQVEGIKGFLEALHDQPWCAGAYVWEMNRRGRGLIVPNGLGNALTGTGNEASHDILGKPIENVFRVFFSKTISFPPTPAKRPSRQFR